MTAFEVPDQEPMLSATKNIPSGPVDVMRGALFDLRESDHKLKMVATTVAGLGTAAVNAAKIPLVTAPTIALEALQYTNNPLVGGIVSGAVFGGWTWAASGVINSAGNHYPAAKVKAKERYSKTADFLSESLPGLHAEDNHLKQDESRVARLGNSALVHTKRGTAIVGVGAIFYIVAAQLEEMPKKEVKRLRRLAAADGAFMIGSISVAAVGLVAKISDSHPELADRIHEGSTDTKTLFALAATLIASQGLSRWRKKHKARSDESVQLPTPRDLTATPDTE